MASSLVIHQRRGEYSVEIAIGSEQFSAVVDTGFTNPGCHTGLCVDAALFDRLRPGLLNPRAASAYDITGTLHRLRSGTTTARIVGLDDSAVETRVKDGGSNVVGVCFLTKLVGYRLEWSFSDRTRRIRRA